MTAKRYKFIHRLLRARDWQHRDELDQLVKWWREFDSGICCLVGIGGAGKTAITDRFLRILPGVTANENNLVKDNTLRHPDRLFVFSFYDAPNPDHFVSRLYCWLRNTIFDPKAAIPSYQEMLGALEESDGCLLVLDGMEKIQDIGLRGGIFGQITDLRIRELTQRLTSGLLPRVSAIISTRFPIAALEEEDLPHFQSIRVENIPLNAGIQLLRDRGVNGSHFELQRIVKDCGQHALTIDMAGGYLAVFANGDPNTPLNLETTRELEARLKAEKNAQRRAVIRQEYRFARIAERYRTAFEENNPTALDLLQGICLFRLGVDKKTLVKIFVEQGEKAPTHSRLVGLSDERLRQLLDLLTEMRLLEQTVLQSDEGFDGQAPFYMIHPAVKDGFLSGLDSQVTKDGHEAARIGLQATLGGRPGGRQTQPSDPGILDLIEEIIYHTIQAGMSDEAWHTYWYRIGNYHNLGFRLGEYERGNRICRAFAASDIEGSISTDPADYVYAHGDFFLEWGCYLRELGDLALASFCLEHACRLHENDNDFNKVCEDLFHQAHVHVLQGQLEQASIIALKCVDVSRRLGHGAQRKALAYYGHVLAVTGNVKLSLQNFNEAIKIKLAYDKSERLISVRGIFHTSCLMRLGRHRKAELLTQQNKKSLLNAWGKDDDDVPKCNLVLTTGLLEQGQPVKKLLSEAIEWGLQRDAKETICLGLAQKAAAWLENDVDYQKYSIQSVLYDLDEALRICVNCGYGIYHIDNLLLRARVRLKLGDADGALDDVLVAIETGIRHPEESGVANLRAASEEGCHYGWAIPLGLQIRAEAQLLKSAQTIGKCSIAPAKKKSLPLDARNLVEKAKTNLNTAMSHWQTLRDPQPERKKQNHKLGTRSFNFKARATSEILERLSKGTLTGYPLKPVTETQGDAEAQVPNSSPIQLNTRQDFC